MDAASIMHWEQEQVDFLSRKSWTEQKFREKLGPKSMFVTCSDRCIKLIERGWQEIDDLQSTQEEADTCMLLHAKHAAETIPALICITEDQGWGRLQKPDYDYDYDYSAHKIIDYDYDYSGDWKGDYDYDYNHPITITITVTCLPWIRF